MLLEQEVNKTQVYCVMKVLATLISQVCNGEPLSQREPEPGIVTFPPQTFFQNPI